MRGRKHCDKEGLLRRFSGRAGLEEGIAQAGRPSIPSRTSSPTTYKRCASRPSSLARLSAPGLSGRAEREMSQTSVLLWRRDG